MYSGPWNGIMAGTRISCLSFFSGNKLDRAAHTGHFERRILQTAERLHERSRAATKTEDFRIQQAPLTFESFSSSEGRGPHNASG